MFCRFLKSIITNTASCVSKPEDAADVLEATLEAYFRDVESYKTPPGMDQSQYPSSPTDCGQKWNFIIKVLAYPSRQEKVMQFLEVCVAHGHALLIYAYIIQRRTNGEHCKSIRDEEVLLVSLLDWLRHIQLRCVIVDIAKAF